MEEAEVVATARLVGAAIGAVLDETDAPRLANELARLLVFSRHGGVVAQHVATKAALLDLARRAGVSLGGGGTTSERTRGGFQFKKSRKTLS